MTTISQKITTFLWFDNQAEEAARFYTSLFEDGRIVAINHYTDAAPEKAGSVMLVTFELAGQKFHALNGGDRSTSSMNRSRCSSNAKPKAKLMSFGASIDLNAKSPRNAGTAGVFGGKGRINEKDE
jgi:predicted 3-demethylubiquinone-9 3-methyltransferase (glyoxalase superfamily)